MAGYKVYIGDVLKEKERERREAEGRAEALKNALYDDELYAVEKEMALSMAKVTRAVVSGGDIKKLFADAEKKCDGLKKKREELLNAKGHSFSDLKPKYKCPLCSDTGRVSGEFCRCVIKRAKEKMYCEMASGAAFSGASFENFNINVYPVSDKDGNPLRERMAAVLKAAEEFSKNPSGNLLFLGKTGLGKTHLSIAIANELLKKGEDVFYISAPTLFARIEKERFTENADETLSSAVSAGLLIIDDLGAEMKSNMTVSSLYRILNERLQNGRPTIINSNLSVPEISSVYDERIASRIFGNFDAYMFLGQDIRVAFKN